MSEDLISDNENPLGLAPEHGFRVVRDEHNGNVLLGMSFRNAEFQGTVWVGSYVSDTEGLARELRDRCLLEALARFRNAGGSWTAIGDLLQGMRQTRNFAIHLPPPWELLTTFTHGEDVGHVFWHPQEGNAVLFMEDVCVHYDRVDNLARKLGVDSDGEAS